MQPINIRGGENMKKIIVLVLLVCGISSAYSQITQDMYDKKVEEIANLKKQLEDATLSNKNTVITFQSTVKSCQDTIKALKSELSNLEKYKSQKKIIDAQLKIKSDSIGWLKTQLAEKDKQISIVKQRGEQKAQQTGEQSRQEVLAGITNLYKNKSFDDLIKFSTKESVLLDMQLVGNNAEIKPILNDLLVYFNAKELLAKKFDIAVIKNTQSQLAQVKRQSVLLDKLKENIDSYQDFNNELKRTINNLTNLDTRKSADGDAEIQKLKFNEIISELANYMYNYYDYGNYPYLSDILLEIVKRKHSNADVDISDLLKKLQ